MTQLLALDMTQILALGIGVLLLGAAGHAAVTLVRREQSRARLAALMGDEESEPRDEAPRQQGFVARRLFLAGFRRRDAVVWFDLATAAGLAAGAAAAWIGSSPAVRRPAAGHGSGRRGRARPRPRRSG